MPQFTEVVNGVPIDYYEMTIESFDIALFPGHGLTSLVGYNGTAPGPTFRVENGRETVVRVLNHGNRTAAMHLHGMSSHAVWDGWAADELEIGQYKDYYYPNNEGSRTIWYHDHAERHTAVDAYEGQSGVYIIYDPAEDSLGLPSGKYDIPLCLSDKTYQDNGQLVSIEDIDLNFVGEFIQVNEQQPWPYLEVEPRKYRFRLYDMSVSRPYDLYIVDEDANWLEFQVIGSDSGLFGHPVATNDLTMAMGERYDSVVDFSGVKGRNLTFANKLQNPAIEDFENTDKVMRFVVGHEVSDDSNNSAVPDTLNANLELPRKQNSTKVDQAFNFQMGGDATWTINGVAFSDPNARVLAKPPQGAIELWELRHTGGPGVHPVHIHLVNMQIVSRSGGPRGLLPYETAGLKDTVFLQPGEVVHVLAYYGPWNGLYMFHCHNLVHEDHEMMAAFNVTRLEELGYNFESTQGFDDPEGKKYSAVDFSADAYDYDAKHSLVRSLGELNAYQPASSIKAAQASWYAENGDNRNPSTTSVTQSESVAPSSAGEGFSSSVTSEALPGFEALPTVDLLDELGLDNPLRRDDTTTSPKWQTLAKPTAFPATTATPSHK
ncbi:hypothetical protein WHR41_09184 [Cladosporium halotolerans]|uniref:Cupredoxin n=1 Tax=Cladosporium halotolerans TaxID=1052096 RepID=A0AB34KAS2_9PEZI